MDLAAAAAAVLKYWQAETLFISAAAAADRASERKIRYVAFATHNSSVSSQSAITFLWQLASLY